ncbi:uncharacterized protein LOC117183155 [Belonocnema kinseyi]|uniref:uncharacterized protein LOC117183155 n=1 Tax=Belonocnema kinseyi TaxID=2817044 RepID=UPI00143DC926|nr:uncharacterized protein LOC117183155 [Belonocnema kinseyi]
MQYISRISRMKLNYSIEFENNIQEAGNENITTEEHGCHNQSIDDDEHTELSESAVLVEKLRKSNKKSPLEDKNSNQRNFDQQVERNGFLIEIKKKFLAFPSKESYPCFSR